MKENALLLISVNAAIEAGDAILEVYDTNFDVELKSDNSPLTMADKKANNCIVERLKSTTLPILSEEGKEIPFEDRKNWERFWMVDPLDGTKEFVKRNGEFTVNIALIDGNFPVIGVIYVPVKRRLYFNTFEGASYKVENVSKPFNSLEELMMVASKSPSVKGRSTFTIVGSKSHPSPETKKYIEEAGERKGKVDVVSMGSSLKLCLVAEGVADEYPRFAPTMEWDTAAGQAIAEASGAVVINWETKKRMAYNKENLLNSWFLVTRDRQNHYS